MNATERAIIAFDYGLLVVGWLLLIGGFLFIIHGIRRGDPEVCLNGGLGCAIALVIFVARWIILG